MELKKLLIEVVQKQISKVLKSDTFKNYIKNIVNECISEALSSPMMESATHTPTKRPVARKSNNKQKTKSNSLLNELREMVKDDINIPNEKSEVKYNNPIVEKNKQTPKGLDEVMFDPTRNKKLLELMSEKSKRIRKNPPVTNNDK